MSAGAAAVSGMVEPYAVISRFREHDYSLQDFLAARVEKQPQDCAIEFEGRQWTYAGLDEFVGLVEARIFDVMVSQDNTGDTKETNFHSWNWILKIENCKLEIGFWWST